MSRAAPARPGRSGRQWRRGRHRRGITTVLCHQGGVARRHARLRPPCSWSPRRRARWSARTWAPGSVPSSSRSSLRSPRRRAGLRRCCPARPTPASAARAPAPGRVPLPAPAWRHAPPRRAPPHRGPGPPRRSAPVPTGRPRRAGGAARRPRGRPAPAGARGLRSVVGVPGRLDVDPAALRQLHAQRRPPDDALAAEHLAQPRQQRAERGVRQRWRRVAPDRPDQLASGGTGRSRSRVR